ncbi:MAG: thiamine-phosphate kinase, partial [Prevotellaceae bacterium]|jgi:thiamine-monophosphate kinase|nr:thiamine-phosphate kinase [Prevotellaceae bacterium]
MLQICKRSDVGVQLYLDKIPIAKDCMELAEEMSYDAVTAALNGGEDYELLLTVPIAMHDRLKDFGGIAIGHIVDKERGALLIPPNGEPVRLQAQGFR